MQEVNDYLKKEKENFEEDRDNGAINEDRFDAYMNEHHYLVERVVTESATIASVQLNEI